MKTKGTSSSSAGYFYKGLALTSIDVIKTGDTSWGGNPLVHFDGTIKGRADDKDATFLKNIKEVKDATGKKVLEAEKLTVAQAKAIINQASSDGTGKPLFCIHGFSVQPRGHLKAIKEATVNRFNQGKFMPIPVMWPSGGGVKYLGDRKTTPGAGNGLKSLKKALDSFPSKSLLAHSMGNRVLRHAADSKLKFDNIFMVAADVRHDIFHKDYINSGDANDENRTELQGKKICSMLSSGSNGKPKGKVYVLYNGADYALTGSRFIKLKLTSRLGAIGAHSRRNWMSRWTEDKKVTHPDIVDCIENVGCNSKFSLSQKTAHSYQYLPQIVTIYQEKHF